MNARFARFVMSVLLIILLTLAVAPSAAQEGPAPVGLRPDAPPYALHGPYWVGARDFVIDPDSERPLTLTVWYPALNPDGLPEDITYTVPEQCAIRTSFPDQTDWSITGHALAAAAPDVSAAPYPLIIYAHGSGGWRSEGAWSTEHLASMGFVVIAPDHLGSGEAPWLGPSEAIFNRPNAIRRAIEYAEQLTAADGALTGLLDATNVGIDGWSLGGSTSLALGGAKLDLAGFDALCAEHPDADPLAACPDLRDNRAQMLNLAGLTEEPEGLWPVQSDPRVQAIVSSAGVAVWYGPVGLAEVSVPTLVVYGTDDADVPPQWNAEPTYANVASARKAEVVLASGNHYLFENACGATPWMLVIGFSTLCSNPVWDMDRAHDLINHFETAFFLATLKGDAEAAAALAPDAVQFPGVTYQAQGFWWNREGQLMIRLPLLEPL